MTDPATARMNGLQSLGSQTIVGASPGLVDAVERARRIAASSAAGVLVVGGAGTGKELLARGIHYAGSPYEPFLAFNCAAVPEHLLAGELFGNHPTLRADAPPARRGLAEMAGAGTLFVGEVARLPLPLQRRLAAAIRDRQVVREGGESPVRVACRVVVASSAPTAVALEAGTLDPALLDVLAPAQVELPPLRSRPGDVELLAQYFLHLMAGERGVELRLEADAVEALESYEWPGNVRELKHVVERAAMLVEGPSVQAEHMVVQHRTARSGLSNGSLPAAAIHIPTDGKPLARIEGEAVALTLGLTRGNQSAAARILGISRPTLARKLREHGIAARP